MVMPRALKDSRSSALDCRVEERMKMEVGWPSATLARAMCLPMYPVAPKMRTLLLPILLFFCHKPSLRLFFCEGARVSGELRFKHSSCGFLDDHAGLVAAIKGADVVISALGGPAIPEQEKIIAAIKEAGTVKRFLPSEYGNDVDHATPLEPVKTIFGKKVAIRRKVEEAGIPFTYVSTNAFAGYTLSNIMQFGKPAPPRDKVVIYGSGDVKAIFLKEEDIGVYIVKTVDDPKTLNKIVYLRPPANILTVNEVVALWEKKIGKTLEKEYIDEATTVELIKTSPIPKNIVLATIHNIFVKGDQTNFEIGEKGVEATALYPDVKYTTASEYLDKFV